jgi:glutathione synthase/RimK-type ligase-like ATP-grasp enzyme
LGGFRTYVRCGREDRSHAQSTLHPKDRFLSLSKRSRLFQFTKFAVERIWYRNDLADLKLGLAGRAESVILFWGAPGDAPLAQVRRAVERRGVPTVLVDQRAVLETEIDLFCGKTVGGALRIGSAAVDLGAVTAAYVRPYGPDQLPLIRKAGPNSPEWRHAMAIFDALSAWVELTAALVVNPPSAMATNDSKPNQARLIKEAGFSIPETLVTTDEEAVRDFAATHGEIVYKSISSVRSIVRRFTEENSARLKFLRWCPTQFQEYIEGDDFRVHVVGDDLFACQIKSTADDYRYGGGAGSVELRACDLERALADRCRLLARSLGLVVAGIDLRLDPKKGWRCFEVNPSPAFGYFQHATGHHIDEAIASLLTKKQAAEEGGG